MPGLSRGEPGLTRLVISPYQGDSAPYRCGHPPVGPAGRRLLCTRTPKYHTPGTLPRRGQQRVSMTTATVADSILSAPAPRGAALVAIRHWWAPTRLGTADWRSVLASCPVDTSRVKLPVFLRFSSWPTASGADSFCSCAAHPFPAAWHLRVGRVIAFTTPDHASAGDEQVRLGPCWVPPSASSSWPSAGVTQPAAVQAQWANTSSKRCRGSLSTNHCRGRTDGSIPGPGRGKEKD